MLLRHANYDSVSPRPSFDVLPAQFVERSSQPALIFKALLLGTMALLVAVPVAMIAMGVATAPAERMPSTLSPFAALQLAMALIALAGLILLPLSAILARIGRRRSVHITRDAVHLQAHGLLSQRRQMLAITDYRGVTYRVRTTLSGTRHEILLVHPQPENSVLLAAADHAGDVSVARAAAALGVLEVPARDVQSLFWAIPVIVRRQENVMVPAPAG